MLGSGMLVFIVYLTSLTWKNGNTDKYIAAPPVIFLALLILSQAFRRRVIITGNSIIQVTLFKTKELPVDSIKGYRDMLGDMFIEPVDPTLPRIAIANYGSFTHSEDLRLWLKENFIDLSETDLAREEQEFKEDGSHRHTPEQRMQQLKQAKVIATIYNIIGIVAPFVLMYFHNNFAGCLRISLPLLGLFIILQSRKMIRFFPSSGKSIYPSVGMGIMLSSFLLLMYTVDYYDCVSLSPIWPYAVPLALSFAYVLYKKGWNDLVKPMKGQALFIIVTACIYAPSAIININCIFDASAAHSYYTKVLKKYITTGKGGRKHHTFRIASWQPGYHEKNVEISRSLYDARETGQTVEVFERNGLLGIHWFTVKMPEDNMIMPLHQ